MKFFLAGACFGLALGVCGIWWAQGQHSATLNEEFIEKVIVIEDGDCAEEFDPDFCIERKRVGTPTFKIGLMDFTLPVVGVLLAITGGLVFLSLRKRDAES